MKTMVVDIGSNTVKYNVFSLKDGTLTELGHASEAVKLISYIDEKGELSGEGLDRLCGTLTRFAADADGYKCKKIYAFATAGLRRTSDPQAVIGKIEERTGLRVRLLSAEEEGKSALAGVFLTCPMLPRAAVMIDMGGGSTELNFFEDRSSKALFSLPFGALSLKQTFGVGEDMDASEEKKIFGYVDEAFSGHTVPDGDSKKTAILVGGKAQACVKLLEAFFGIKVKNSPVKRETFAALLEAVQRPSDAQRAAMKALIPDRYDVMAAGLTGYEGLFRRLGAEDILFCRGGIREGYLQAVEGIKCLRAADKADKKKEKSEKKEAKKEPKEPEETSGRLLFEGMISLRALFDAQKSSFNDRKIEKLLYAKERIEKKKSEYLFLTHRAEEFGFEIELRPKKELQELAVGGSHGGVLALCSERTVREISLEDLPEKGFFVALEGMEDPYNLGYALRSIYAAGADGVLFLGKERFGSDGTVCRSSAGASERLPIYSADPAKAAELFKSAGYKIVCADQPNSVPMYEADLSRPLLLVVGGEKRGINGALLKHSDAVVRIDYGRSFDAALSAASASAVLAFEVFRQNRKKF